MISLFSSTWISPWRFPWSISARQARAAAMASNRSSIAVGLGHVGVGADAEAVQPVGGVAQGGEHHDRGEHRRAVAPEAAADVEAVDVGEHQVEEDDVRAMLPGQLQAGLARRRRSIGSKLRSRSNPATISAWSG